MSERIDETWHRLREWTSGQAPSERLSAQILLDQGYKELDPSHPLGGPDGGKDALAVRNGKVWLMAVYFPKGQQTFTAIEKKFTSSSVDGRGSATDLAKPNALFTARVEVVSTAGRLRDPAPRASRGSSLSALALPSPEAARRDVLVVRDPPG